MFNVGEVGLVDRRGLLELPEVTVGFLFLPWLSVSGTSGARGRCTWCPELKLVMLMVVALSVTSMLCPGSQGTTPGWAGWRW